MSVGTSNFLQVFGQVGFGEGLDAKIGGGEAGHHALEPEGVADAFGDFCAGPVVAVERQREVLEKLRAVGHDAGAEPVEDLDRQAAGIGGGLEHERRDGADEDGLGDALGAVAADVAGDFAAAGGMADVDGVFQVELFDESSARSSA